MKNPTRLALLIAAALPLSACASAPPGTTVVTNISDGESLIRAMHDRYAGRWYRTLTFEQKTTRPGPNDSVRVDTWYEYGAIPGRLRIEFAPREAGNGAIYANDSIYAVRNGRVTVRRAQRNSLLILGFDVYGQAPEQSIRMLREEGFPMGPVRMDTWRGRPVYVVGGAPGDVKSTQWWVDAERLVYVRSFEPAPSPDDSTRVMEVHFDGYERFGGGWVATLVDILVNGRSIKKEEYSNVRVDFLLDPALFVPERWSDAPHPAP